MCKFDASLGRMTTGSDEAKLIVAAAHDGDGLTMEECSAVMCTEGECARLMEIMEDGYVSMSERKDMIGGFDQSFKHPLRTLTTDARRAGIDYDSMDAATAEQIVEKFADLDGLTEADCAEIGLSEGACEDVMYVLRDSYFNNNHLTVELYQPGCDWMNLHSEGYRKDFINVLDDSRMHKKRIEFVQKTNSTDDATVQALIDLMDWRKQEGGDGFGVKELLAAEAALALGRIGPVNEDVVPALIKALDDENVKYIYFPYGSPVCRFKPSLLAMSAVHALGEIGPAAEKARFALWRMKVRNWRSPYTIKAEIELARDSVKGRDRVE